MFSTIRLEKILFWLVRAGAYILPFTLLVVTDALFFPFITGKNFLFRIIVEVLAAGWIGLLILDFKKYWPRWNFVSIAFAAFVGAIFLSAVLGVDFKHSFWSNFERMEGLVTHFHLLLLFFVFAGTFRTRREWFTLFGVSMAASILVAFWGLLEYSGEIVSVADSSRIISTLGNPLYVAAYLSFHIFLTAYLWFQTKSTFLRWALGGIILFELAIFFLTAARGAFVGMLAGLGIIFLLQIFVSRGIKRKVIFSSIIVVLLFVPILLHVFQDAPFIQNNDALSRFSNITLQAGEARFTIWGMAFESFKERPVLGWGIGNFSIPYAKYYDSNMFGQESWFDRTHNMPLEWLVTGGSVGFLAYLTLLGSMIWALIQGVKRNILQKRSAFLFVGMFAAYLVQLLFVFDTLSSYLTLMVMLGFFFAISSTSSEVWSRKNTLTLSQIAESSSSNNANQLSRKERRAQERQTGKINYNTSVSLFRISGVFGIFVVAIALVVFINIRPWMANATFMNALGAFSDGNAEKTQEYTKKALSLSRGTIGTPEIREHLAINTYTLSGQPELLKEPEVNALYRFAVEEMEKQVQENSQKDLKIKHNILLAQLYGMLAVLGNNNEALKLSMNQYEKTIQFAPNYIQTYPVMANTLAQRGRINEALPLIEKAEGLLNSVGKYDSKIFYSKPLFYTALGQYNEAYKALEELSRREGAGGRLSPDMVEKIVLTTRSQGPDAIPFLEKLYLLDRNLNSVALMLAQLNAAAGDTEKARFYAAEALKQDPTIKDQVDAFFTALDEATSTANSIHR